MINVNKAIDDFVKDYGDKIAIRKGVFSLLNNSDFLKIHPEAKKHKNLILSKIDKSLEEQKKRTNDLKMFAFLGRIANDVIREKANKLVKLQKFIEKSDIPADLKEKITNAKDKMSQSIINAYGLLKHAFETGSDKEFKTAIVSILSLASDNEKNKDLTLFIFKDINEESDIDFEKVENFFNENKELMKLDRYVEEFEKLVSISEKEKEKKRLDISF